MTADAERLRALHEAAERISASLVELELDSGRQLLATSALEGESAARWAAASDALTELWRRRQLLEELLERADRARQTRSTTELRTLLNGRSIDLARDVPLAQRTLLGTIGGAERCSARDLIASMSEAFDEVKGVVSAFGAAWETLAPSLEVARELLRACAQRAGELGDPGRDDLKRAEAEAQRLSVRMVSDPLSIAPGEIDQLTGTLRGIRDELEEIAALAQRFDVRMLEARRLLERVMATEQQARSAQAETSRKIAQAPCRPLRPAPAGLEAELTGIGDLAQRGAWTEARRALEAWSGRTQAWLDEAVKSRDANRALIEARDQFRALLEAYQVKAKRLGRLEDPDMTDLYARAQDALYTAPTDLAVAARLVRCYQESLIGSGPSSETPS